MAALCKMAKQVKFSTKRRLFGKCWYKDVSFNMNTMESYANERFTKF